MKCQCCVEGVVVTWDGPHARPEDCACCGGNWEFCPQCSAALEDQEEDR